MQGNQLWYTRRGNQVRGPFPAPQISRFILLGRIIETDELSADQINWQPVSSVPVLIPEELKADPGDPRARERLLMARMREDERSAIDRRQQVNEKNIPTLDRRQKVKTDRRRQEDEQLVRHREVKTAIAESSKEDSEQEKGSYFLRGVMAMLLIAGIVGGAWYYQPWEMLDSADCKAPAQPWVDWSNCLKEGVRLAATDLRGARMRNANLAGADLRGSQLGGADIAYTNLVGANLTGTEMSQAALVGANLRNADLSQAKLDKANLAYAVFQGANLTAADLTGADMSNADLKGAMITLAKLSETKLDNAIWTDGKVCAAGSIGECK
ncbi:pentapeptide repeat-containing protein [Kaarinaea lacus]